METGNRLEGPHAAPTALSRRQLLRLFVASAGATALRLPYAPSTAAATTSATTTHGFLTSAELAILDAATARIVPTDSQSGARECRVIDYIQSMLSYMPGTDANCDRHVSAADLTATVIARQGSPTGCAHGGDVDGNGVVDAQDVVAAESAVFAARPVLAGGPFSGRQAQPHAPTGATPCYVCHVAPAQQGTAAMVGAPTVQNYNTPPDFFTQHLSLSRLHALSWKIRILGASAVPEAVNNPLATQLLEVDLRNAYRNGLAALDAYSMQPQHFGKPFVQLTANQQTSVLNATDQNFVTLLTYHTVEGMLCPPEYGGNRDRLGWDLVRFDGDSQPLGYTIYDEITGTYSERSDKPNSRPNPDEDCSGFSTKVNLFLTAISTNKVVAPGGVFADPFCFVPPAGAP